jgi:Immunity protein 52
MPEFGSNIWGSHTGPPPHDFRESSYAETSCHVGSYLNPGDTSANNIRMRLSALRLATGRPWRASELRPMMKFAREIWNPTAMCVMFPFYMNFPSVPLPLQPELHRRMDPMLGWITYLPADLAARAKYPADVEVEKLSDGAVLVTLCEEMFEETDAEGMARLHRLEAALRPIQT